LWLSSKQSGIAILPTETKLAGQAVDDLASWANLLFFKCTGRSETVWTYCGWFQVTTQKVEHIPAHSQTPKSTIITLNARSQTKIYPPLQF